jgi:ubiquinol-cytochrome c reductase cytochrome c subunit
MKLAFALVAAALLAGSAAFAAAAPQGNAARGKETMVRVGCWSCHGYEGQGGPAGPRLAPNTRPYAAFSAFVRTTSANMPPYTEHVLPEADLRDIHAYLSAIPAGPAAAGIPVLQQIGN